MTLSEIIQNEYQPNEIYTMPSSGEQDEHYRALRDEWDDRRKAQLRILNGHIRYGWHNAFGNDAYEYFTVLRHPIDRVLSYFSQQWEPEFTLDELVQHSDKARNTATFVLSGGTGRDVFAFQEAWARILSKEIVAGTVDRFDRFVLYLRGRYGWSDKPYRSVNITPERLQRSDVPQETQNIILKHNWYDYLLYAGVLAKGNKR